MKRTYFLTNVKNFIKKSEAKILHSRVSNPDPNPIFLQVVERHLNPQ